MAPSPPRSDPVAPLPLVAAPTPVGRLAVPGLRGRLWVKDEGRAGALYGGNKVRKLRWILARALADGQRDLVTFGGVGSHHVIATARYGRAHGMRTHALLFPQPDAPGVAANAARIADLCASWSPLFDPLRSGPALARLYARLGHRPMRIAVGGSSALGTRGWVEAGEELAAQVKAGELPAPARVYVALGTGGTVAGLRLGLARAGLQTQVVGVRVVGHTAANRARNLALCRRVLRLEGRAGPITPLRIVHRWFRGGYGVVDDAVTEVVHRARDLGLTVEGTYTAKALGAALEELASDPVDAVFLQTCSTLPEDGAGALDPELARLITTVR